MGDRAQALITEDGTTGVYLYTHWEGSDLPTTVANALDRGRDRWDDGPYLARIIFSEMIRNDIDGTTGYGISNRSQDGGSPIAINVTTGEITHDHRTYSFEEFIARERLGR